MGRSFLMLRMGVQGWARGPFRRGGVVVGEAGGIGLDADGMGWVEPGVVGEVVWCWF
jgi:hypothetical protein